MKNLRSHRPAQAAFTMVEILISLTIVTGVMAMALSTFLFGIKMMYKDNQRLATNATLRYFMAQMSKTTLDASEFYIFANYESLDGTVNTDTDLTTAVTDSYGIDLYHGDCLVLVTRMTLDDNAKVRQVTVYYRTTTQNDKEGALRCFEGTDYLSAGGSTKTLNQLLSEINLKSTPIYPNSKLLAARAIGRVREDVAADNPALPSDYRYPIFASKAPELSTENESVSINCEIINGSTINNLLSSSSFNYTISPRR